MKGQLIDLAVGMDGRQRLSIALDGDFRESWDALHAHDVEVSVKRYRKRRSLDANAYFHVLAHEIARAQGLSDTEAKRWLNTEYGAMARLEDGSVAGAMLPEKANALDYYPYARAYTTREIDGRRYTCYVFYRHTSDLDSAEMAKLIDGAVQEAKQLGIETMPPHEIAAMEAAWEGQR